MATTYTYPHWSTNVADKSRATVLTREVIPLHLPIFFGRAQRGPVGTPYFAPTYTAAVAKYGEGTFDDSTPYYSRESLYMNRLFASQGCMFVRLASEDAKHASLVLECTVRKKDIPQFERDAFGQYKRDPDTNETIPIKDSGTQQQLVEPGVELKWSIRELDLVGGETLTNLKPTTFGTGENEYVVYPIYASLATDPGEYGNDQGIKLFCEVDTMDPDVVSQSKSLQFTFGAVAKTYGQDTVSPIQNFWGEAFSDFVAKPNVTDSRTARRISFDDIIRNDYSSLTRASLLSWKMRMFSENIETIGNLIMDLEPEDLTLTSPFMVNIFGGINSEGAPMPHVAFSEDPDHISLNSTRIMYMSGGDDGEISDAVIEELHRQYLADVPYPELLDQARYPFTHVYDTGVSMQTKYAMTQFMGKHDAFKLVLACQDANSSRWNSKAEDQSAGAALYARALLQPESIVKGTECCRAEIYQQAGYLAEGNYNGVIPTTLDIMLKKASCMSTDSMGAEPKGLPFSACTLFREINWTPSGADHKQRSWDTGLNYLQYSDMTGLFWPDMRTVYRYDTSVLTDAIYTDAIVFTKHACRYNWAKFSGTTMEFSTFATRAGKSLTNLLSRIYGGKYNFTAKYEQDEKMRQAGYISRAKVDLFGNPTSRVHQIEIDCYRNGYSQSEEQ